MINEGLNVDEMMKNAERWERKNKMKSIGKKIAIGAGIAGVGIVGFVIGAKTSQKSGIKLVKAGVKTGAIQGFNIGMHAGFKLKGEESKENFTIIVDEAVDQWSEGFVNAMADELSVDELEMAKEQVVEPVTEGLIDLKERVSKDLE